MGLVELRVRGPPRGDRVADLPLVIPEGEGERGRGAESMRGSGMGERGSERGEGEPTWWPGEGGVKGSTGGEGGISSDGEGEEDGRLCFLTAGRPPAKSGAAERDLTAGGAPAKSGAAERDLCAAGWGETGGRMCGF